MQPGTPPAGIEGADWELLCKKFASAEFQKVSAKNRTNSLKNEVPPVVGTVSIARIVDMRRREGKEISAIDKYKIGHFSAKKKKMVNEKADDILNELLHEKESSTCSPAEICMKVLHYIPGHTKGRSVSVKKVLDSENLRMELESEKEKSKALEEELHVVKQKQTKYEENQGVIMAELSRLSKLQSQNS
uniref:uncharacterized protein LOC122596502 n=1 Tax=Erigeron canadensis TaxID=72917 RepID=UPI001CB8963E|nr:uncharacterized protein LOC122596502 [Erigeron canadensis]